MMIWAKARFTILANMCFDYSKVDESWKDFFASQFAQPYIYSLCGFLNQERKDNKTIFPKEENWFNTYILPLDKISVVILGQDPYHGFGQAHGFAFSVPNGVSPPPSLRNIYKELENEFSAKIDKENGNLIHWFKQGVFLLNSCLTVEEGKPASHSKAGWQHFTDNTIQHISQNQTGVVFLLWGKFAQSKAHLIDSSKHLVLTANHPSPFSAYKGFFGCNHFIQCNEYLVNQGKNPIKWIPPYMAIVAQNSQSNLPI